MKKQDDQFVKEKLDLVLRDADVPVPDSLRAEYAALASGLQPAEKKRAWMLPTFIPIAAALIAAIVLCSIFLPQKDTSYYNYELEEKEIVYEELSQYNFLLPDWPTYVADLLIYHDINSDIAVFAKLCFTYPMGIADIIIKMVNDYTPDNTALFESLSESSATELFSYDYHIYEGRQALAKFEYKNYTYYVTYTSEDPEDILLLLQSFSEQS